MNFSICVGGLKYNINSLTKEFYENHAKAFECSFSNDGYEINVDQDILDHYYLTDPKLSNYNNETVYILEKVIKHCLNHQRMIIHGAALTYEGKGYLFIAPSGTGKTTHTSLWKKYLGEEVQIINGDKPMLELSDEIIIHGTPWNGKENIGKNASIPLKAIVVLKQASINHFEKLDTNTALKKMLAQSFFSLDKECGPKVINCISKIINKIPIYCLECDVSKEAFETCYNGLYEKVSCFCKADIR